MTQKLSFVQDLHRSGLAGLAALLISATAGPVWAQETATPAAPEVATPAPEVTAPDLGVEPSVPGDSAPATITPKGGGFGLTKTQTAGTKTNTGGKTISVLPAEPNAPDYAAWERLATRAETAIEDRGTSNAGLELLRGQLVDWRSALLVAQSTNSTRISTLRTQISALGALPAEGEMEAPEIASRRKILTDQLVRLQAPGIAADEAYSRADGLIREIDRLLRERQADELLKLWPTPMNPAHWPEAVAVLRDTGAEVWSEGVSAWQKPTNREVLYGNLPLILGLTVLAVLLIWRGRPWIEGFSRNLEARSSVRGRKIWSVLASLGSVVVPTLGVWLISIALELLLLTGPLGSQFVAALPVVGFSIFLGIWLGKRLFPIGTTVEVPLQLSDERRAEGQFVVSMMGAVLGLSHLLQQLFNYMSLEDAPSAVIRLPLLVLIGILLWRLGTLLKLHVRAQTPPNEPISFGNRLIGLLGRVAVVIGIAGPILAAIGYISAAAALIYPAVMSLALLALIYIMLELVNDAWVLLTRSERDNALVPVLVGFVLSLASLPLFALIWGARTDDILELWGRFLEGFQLGATRISPIDFLYFLVLFGIGFAITRLFQSALKSTILPKTTLDQGGQNAVISGVGYTGIFLAALVAINAAGIDLSGLAMVAGALSLGIGFGLQNIVSNFVSGIILLIERPVSEGDWIEVGTVSGTVKSISVRSTRITTFDRSDVIVPNADLVTQRVTNWTRYNLTGRLIVPITVVHGSDAMKVEAVLREIAEDQPLVVLDPPPTIALTNFTMDGLTFEIRVILRDVNFQLSVKSAINHAVLMRFDQEGISLAHTGAWAKPMVHSGEVTPFAPLLTTLMEASEPAQSETEETDDDPGVGGTPSMNPKGDLL